MEQTRFGEVLFAKGQEDEPCLKTPPTARRLNGKLYFSLEHLPICVTTQQTCLNDVFFSDSPGRDTPSMPDDSDVIAQSVYSCCIQKLDGYRIVYKDVQLDQ